MFVSQNEYFIKTNKFNFFQKLTYDTASLHLRLANHK